MSVTWSVKEAQFSESELGNSSSHLLPHAECVQETHERSFFNPPSSWFSSEAPHESLRPIWQLLLVKNCVCVCFVLLDIFWKLGSFACAIHSFCERQTHFAVPFLHFGFKTKHKDFHNSVNFVHLQIQKHQTWMQKPCLVSKQLVLQSLAPFLLKDSISGDNCGFYVKSSSSLVRFRRFLTQQL